MTAQSYPPLPEQAGMLHDDGYFTETPSMRNYAANYAGWRSPYYSEDQMRAYVDADRTQQSARHREELLAYEVTVGNLRARLEQAQPYANAHDTGAGAIYDFMGWLTTRPEKLILSGSDDAAPAAEAVSAFLDKRGISKLCNPNIMGWSDAAPQPQGEPVAAAGEDLAIYQSIADNYFKSIRPAHTEAEVQSILRNRRVEFGDAPVRMSRADKAAPQAQPAPEKATISACNRCGWESAFDPPTSYPCCPNCGENHEQIR